MRGKIGLDYRQSDVEKVGGASASGTARAGSLMISGYYDFFHESDYFRDSWIQPYVGAGFGLGLVDADSVSPVSGSSLNDDDNDFAHQGMAGIAINVSPRTKVTLGYRYFTILDLKFKIAGGAAVDADYASNEIMLGVRFSFGAPKVRPKATPAASAPALEPMPEEPMPEPPAAAAPAPEMSHYFLVFFDWNQANITSLKVRLSLTSHADRTGTSRYNQRLSMRRFNAARNGQN